MGGNLFGGTVDATLVLGLARIDHNNNLIPDVEIVPDDQVKDRIFFAGLEGGFNMPGVVGLTLQVGLTQLGPLEALISANVPGGILLEPTTGLSINNFTAVVQFFSSLPSITEPEALRGTAFQVNVITPPTNWTPALKQKWSNNTTVQAIKHEWFEAAFNGHDIKGSACILEYVWQAFNGVVDVERDPRCRSRRNRSESSSWRQNSTLRQQGKPQQAYADLSHVAGGMSMSSCRFPDQFGADAEGAS